MIEGIDHVGLSVQSVEKSAEFYCKNFGFKVIRIMKETELLGKVVGMPGCRATIVHLKKGSFVLELFEYKVPNGKPISQDRIQADKGFNHIGFRSTDVRKDFLKLKTAGVNFISQPVELRKNVWLCYFYGPDGEVVEIRESKEPLIRLR